MNDLRFSIYIYKFLFFALTSKILLFQRVMPAYRVPVFKKLFHLFGVVTCYSQATKLGNLSNSDFDLQFPTIRLRRFQYGKSPTAILQNPFFVLYRNKPRIVISEGAPSYLTLWLILFLRVIFSYKLVIWSHGIKYNELEAPFKNLRGKLQLWLFNRSDAVLNYSDIRADILKRYVNVPDKIFVAKNTLDTEQLRTVYDRFSKKGKDKIKQELGFIHRYNLIYIGRLLANKGIKDLLEAFLVLDKNLDVGLHIIGEGPEGERIKKIICTSQNIYHYGSIFDPVINGKMLFASDLMVMPGNIGLSLVNAFSFGCPVITYKSCGNKWPVHGPEIGFLKDNVNGIFCENEPDILAKRIADLIKDPSKIEDLSANALKTAYNEASILNFLNGFRGMLDYLKFNES